MFDITKDSPFIYYNFIDKYKLNLFHCVHLSNSHAVHIVVATTKDQYSEVFFDHTLIISRCTISKRVQCAFYTDGLTSHSSLSGKHLDLFIYSIQIAFILIH